MFIVSPAGSSPSTKGLPESIIANVAGKLLLLQRDHSSAEKKGKRVSNFFQTLLLYLLYFFYEQAQFLAPVVLASGVEHVWASAYSKPSHRYLLEALWLGCGAGGMKVTRVGLLNQRLVMMMLCIGLVATLSSRWSTWL